MSYAVSGATTISASDAVGLGVRSTVYHGIRASAASLVTLTAGSNTFTSKYRGMGGGNETYFSNREIFVMNLA
jgi:hypothetical protein